MAFRHAALDVPNPLLEQRKVLEKLDIEESLLAKVCESRGDGLHHGRSCETDGSEGGTPVSGRRGDYAAAAVGTGVVRDSKAFTTIGTSGVVFAPYGSNFYRSQGQSAYLLLRSARRLACDGRHPGRGTLLKWFRDNFNAEEKRTAEGMGWILFPDGPGSAGVPHWLQ